MSIKELIELAHDKGIIGEVNYSDLIEELEDLYNDQAELTNIKLWGEEGEHSDE